VCERIIVGTTIALSKDNVVNSVVFLKIKQRAWHVGDMTRVLVCDAQSLVISTFCSVQLFTHLLAVCC
jgi:hypothetical protein